MTQLDECFNDLHSIRAESKDVEADSATNVRWDGHQVRPDRREAKTFDDEW